MFSVIYLKFYVFAVKLVNFLMFTLSRENTVKCLEGFREKLASDHCKNMFRYEYNDDNKVENFRVSPQKSSPVFGHSR